MKQVALKHIHMGFTGCHIKNIIRLQVSAISVSNACPCRATFEDTRRIEEQIRKLTGMYQKLHPIVIRFQVK